MEESLDESGVYVGSVDDNFEKEQVQIELMRIDEARKILEKKYPNYEIFKDFIDHLASTEKVFVLAGIKKFGGDEIMEIFLESETRVMVSETGIDADVFAHIKEQFVETHKTISGIHDAMDHLRNKYPENAYHCDKFIQYLEEYLLMLLTITKESNEMSFDIDLEKEKAIHKIMEKIAENDSLEMERLEEIYQEFKSEIESLAKN